MSLQPILDHMRPTFMTNTCRINPNTSDLESGKVYGFALCLFVTEFFGAWLMNQLQQVGVIWHHMQQRVDTPAQFDVPSTFHHQIAIFLNLIIAVMIIT